jgi:hypothetical protein
MIFKIPFLQEIKHSQLYKEMDCGVPSILMQEDQSTPRLSQVPPIFGLSL